MRAGLLIGAACVLPVFVGCDMRRGYNRVETSHDRFRGTTTTRVKFTVDRGFRGFDPSARGDTPIDMELLAVANQVTIMMIATTPTRDGWRFLRCHGLDFLADGRRLPIPPTEHEGNVGSGRVLEMISADVSPDVVVAMASARRVEGRLCNSEFRLDEGQRALVGQFARLLPRRPRARQPTPIPTVVPEPEPQRASTPQDGSAPANLPAPTQ